MTSEKHKKNRKTFTLPNSQAPSSMHRLPEIGSDELEPFVYCKPEGGFDGLA